MRRLSSCRIAPARRRSSSRIAPAANWCRRPTGRSRRLVDHPVGRWPLRLFHRRHVGLARGPRHLRRRATRRFRRRRDAREGHGRRRDGHHRAVGERPLVGGAGQGRTGHALRADRHRAKTSTVFLERDTIGHPQFCPDDDDLILYAGPLTDRVWITDRSGARNRRLYAREDRMQWVTHEVWMPGRRAVAFVDWPRGMRDDRRRPRRRALAHAYSRPGTRRRTTPATRFVCDTNFPDRGLHTFGCSTASGRRGRSRCARARRRRRARTGAGRFPTMTGRSRWRPPAHASASAFFARRLARAVHVGPDRPCAALRSRAGGGAMNVPPCWKASASAAKSATAASPAPAAGWRTASCSAISPSCRRHTPSTSCSTASATSAPARCWKSPIRAIRCRASSHPTRDLRTDCARYAIYRDGVRQEDRTDITRSLAGRPRRLPDRLRHQLRRRARARRRADRQGPLGAAHHLPTEPAGPFRGDLIVTMRWLTAAAGDHRDAGHVAFSVQSRRADPSRRSGGDRRRSR